MSSQGRTRLRLVALLAFFVHAAVVLYMMPPIAVLGPTPPLQLDWGTHYEQCKRAVETFAASGRTWLWDPHLLAGQVSGAIFDADNKFYELYCIVLVRLGVSFDRAFASFAWVVSAAVYPVVLLAARLFGVPLRGAIVSACLASCLWWFDGFMHWMWFCGMISWASSSYLFLLPLALFTAFIEARAEQRRLWTLAALAPALALTLTVHPYAFFVLAGPMLVLYGRAARELSRREHALVIAVAAVAVMANLWWLRPAIRFWHYILDSGYYLDATPSFILWDWLGINYDPWVTGVVANRTGFRFIALGSAVAVAVALIRARDRRAAWVVTGLAVPTFIAYFGGVTPLLRQVQPYRFIAPAMFGGAVLAGFAFDVVVERARELSAALRSSLVIGGVAILSVLAVPRLIRDMLYFVPQAVPDRGKPLPLPPPNVNGTMGFGALGTLGGKGAAEFRLQPPTRAELSLMDFVRSVDDGSGRFLVEWWSTGEQLAGRTDAQILGGFREINLAHSDANFFRVHEESAPVDPERFRAYLEAFNVKWVVLVKPWPAIESRSELLEPLPQQRTARWFRVKNPSGWIVGGGPGVVRAENDHLSVRGSAGGSLVLRYHYLETLVCRAGCRLRRVESPLTRVGFLGVDDAPADFDIVNAP